MKRILNAIPALVLLLLTSNLAAQQNLTLFLMHDVPQANYVNPAVAYDCDWIIGVPGLSSVHVNYNNSAFAPNEGLRYDSSTDSLYLNFNEVITQLNNTEIVASTAHYTPLYAGFWVKDYWLSLAVSEKVTSFNTVPKAAAELAWYGNTPFVGREASLAGLRANGYHFREYALGLAHQISEKWSVGIHAKLLFGKGSVYTPNTKGGISTNALNFGLTGILDTEVRVSFPIEVELDEEGYVNNIELQEDVDWMQYMMNRKNLGAAFDLGFIYQYDEATTFSGSLLNVGLIGWKAELNTFVSDGVFEFTGTDSSTEFNSGDYIQELADSLRHQFLPKPDNNGFTTNLAPELYLGLTRTLNQHLNAGAVFYSKFLRNKVMPAFTLSANTYNYKKLNASISYTAINGDYFNIGAGLGLKLGMFHLHATADNALGFLKLENQRNLNLRFGMSIVPSCTERSKKKKSPGNKGISAMPCYHNPYKKESRR
ncbi:DUF5723 family protein [Carboxylicivirga sp. M1479]|uniref:DUF5723 family protein n=1 Tax=Carboxylicivirga sp. M1479 TaxID=2594476 RepID=UPI0011780423|nr:DUF5723 family protein [Carboxylicivirga sp. M1479]TRX72405.1 hypothetical protein FNN09_00250 [Carboxylicivirga sp. M1479]